MKGKTGLMVVIILSALLNLLGFNWGIPRDDYRRFYYTNKEETEQMTVGISEEYIKNSWEISKGISPPQEKLPRSLFNIIRSFHPDEHNIIKSISNMSPKKFDFNPHYFEYGTFFIYFVAFLLGLGYILGFIHLTSDLTFYFLHPDQMGRFYLVSRGGVVLLSILGVFFLYKAIENLFGKKAAFYSAFIMAVSPIYVLNSRYITVDVPMVFWISVTIYFITLFLQRGKIKFFYLAGLTTGIAAGTKYPALVLLALLPLVYWNKKESLKKLLSFEVLKTFIFVLVGFIITNPYSVLAFSEFRRGLFYQVETREFCAFGPNLYNHISAVFLNTHIAMKSGFSLFYLVMYIGIIYLIFKKGREKLFLAGVFFTMLPLFLTGGLKYTRYYLLMLPFLAVGGALFITFITDAVKSRFWKICCTVIISFILLIPLLKSFSYSLFMCTKDVRIVSAEFIESNIPAGSTIAFTKDPWIFEVPPVNTKIYNVVVSDKENIANLKEGSHLVIGELQYFLRLGSRKSNENALLSEIEGYGYKVVKIFKNPPKIGPFKFDSDITVHDMIYTHPTIYLFKKI